jgi:hypothetical protein
MTKAMARFQRMVFAVDRAGWSGRQVNPLRVSWAYRQIAQAAIRNHEADLFHAADALRAGYLKLALDR